MSASSTSIRMDVLLGDPNFGHVIITKHDCDWFERLRDQGAAGYQYVERQTRDIEHG